MSKICEAAWQGDCGYIASHLDEVLAMDSSELMVALGVLATDDENLEGLKSIVDLHAQSGKLDLDDCLIGAVSHGCLETVRFLMECGARPVRDEILQFAFNSPKALSAEMISELRPHLNEEQVIRMYVKSAALGKKDVALALLSGEFDEARLEKVLERLSGREVMPAFGELVMDRKENLGLARALSEDLVAAEPRAGKKRGI